MNRKPCIMIVDDEESVRDSLSIWLEEDGYEVLAVESGKRALEEITKKGWSLLLVDLKMPEMDGLQFLAEVKKILPEIPIIIMTAYATVETAVKAIKDGAYDYLMKPFEPEEISMTIKKIMKQQELEQENIYLKKELAKQFQFQELISKNKRMHDIFELVKTVAKTNITVLIHGESGTGKELIARAIHAESLRKDGPFITVSCASLTETLLENELFGHERGAFTGATSTVKGRFELSDGGTLFLDEIGDISLKLQMDLLRVIETKEFTRLGGTIPVKTDVRIISATNKDLIKAIEENKFREDLYYRLNVITIELPPLKERPEDIPLLVQHMIEKFNIETNKRVERVDEEAMAILMQYHWPGNIRELKNVIERSVVLARDNIITKKEIGNCIRLEPDKLEKSQDMSLTNVEKKHIYKVLMDNGWNISKSADILGIDRTTLYKKIKEYELQKS
ncbi:MAG: sigma-54 dependent transcriptional regulator [Deltaproteobacteria bacterium]|nr:sigma-54 dependent transcriptional regulator [Deltaproteobacteria bacterium]MCL5791985.1 sigma-54 dependent transcriptional regulator [Deltaproteobacteria bacterium]